tara:strand:- start:79155 stop:80351 length:1197 start_codon:yes stop_codon:yes gene_type:complete
MIIEISLAILIGTFLGIITGLIPGIHINLISVLILSIFPLLIKFTSPLIITIAIISMAITHTFLDFIPSVFLGAPNSDTALSIFPTHRLLLNGQGYEAVQLSTIGSLFGLIITIILAPILILTVNSWYTLIQDFIPYILITASLILILKDKNKKWALILFLLAGTFGIGALSLNIPQILFPLFSGLFGVSTLIISLKDEINIPPQKINNTDINKKEITKALSSGVIASSLSGFLPGLGASQAAVLASSIMKKITQKGFIVLIGSINTIIMVISFIALYTIDKARNGTIITISKIIKTFSLQHLILFLGTALIVAGLATFLSLNISKIFSKYINKINYQKLCISIISLITILTIILTGFTGLLILIISTSIGLIPPLKNTSRSHLMAVLILPISLYLLL